jgi:arylsulfatase A-like enzyme
MKRASHYFTMFVCVVAAGVLPAPISGAVERDRLNLLFIQTDEQRADTMAAYGNDKIRTPNLDRLARESFVFMRAYVSQPVCTPARSTMMTGLWPHTTALTNNNIPLPDEIPSLPRLLAEGSYRTAFMGKWHLGDEIFPQHGFDEWVSIEDAYISHYRAGKDRAARSSYHHFLLKHGYEPDVDTRFSRGFAARRPIEHCKPAFLEQEACRFLERHQHEPFVLYVSFLEPHMPFYGPLDDEYRPEEVTLPINFDDPLEEDEPEHYRRGRERLMAMGFDGQPLRTEADWRRLIARYWGLVTQVDRSVGGILDTLDRLGLAEKTIVVFTSDHGDMMGSHRLLTKGLMYEESVRVPWLMRVPEFIREGRRIDGPVSHIDLVPTLLDLMGRAIPGNLPGKSLVPVMAAKSTVREPVFIEWPDPHCRTIISPDGWKLCLRTNAKCQLYQLSEDPGECTNLYYTGKHQDVIRRLTHDIRAWQARVGDPLSQP